ncbi:MAG: DUF3500 domain-containing protein [Planctomycetales bacterium]|nr:DUF3500 domain-containing protein [Planctomycetales bacterium]NIM07832.1 DUF3500 domain-containing protein [Planctomycetales bacterium]NIN07324.1 DUF3500 domain-containing protein [Planctomycetales bacterium]NIN76427.1 DUF3500 domain-containing protein [Planctomycetales bacterium]NIO33625.1 DUF3500 domain-containing protein [Planctomycetales bacterium]
MTDSLDAAARLLDGTGGDAVSRRQFLVTAAVAAGGLPILPSPAFAAAADPAVTRPLPAAETVVRRLYESLSAQQQRQVCFDWDYRHPRRGLLRTYISNNWNVTRPSINSEFFSGPQRAMVREIFEGIIQPDWHGRIDQQLKDDAGGFGNRQSIAIFGQPGEDKFEFVMTGRHITLRCDGNSAQHVAFGGPIFYGHAAGGFHEKADHPGNVFWPQAVAANKVFEMLDGRQRKMALVDRSPRESAVGFRGPQGPRPGIPVSELSADQREEVQKVLRKLIEPYRQDDRHEVLQCLTAQGGLEACGLAFYREPDLGGDRVWDNWRLEGPAFVWYFRGAPHVHVWVHVADRPGVSLNA